MPEKKSYQERYGDAVTQEDTQALNVQIFQWTEEGDTLTGMFLGAKRLEDAQYDTPVMRWMFDTDDGRRSAILGSAADKEILPTIRPGDLLMIEYQGKKDIGDGKRVNLFRVERFGHDTPPTEGKEK